jgi:DNA-binding XRE family transcriptional regulator
MSEADFDARWAAVEAGIPARLIALREHLELSPEEMAAKLDMSPRAYRSGEKVSVEKRYLEPFRVGLRVE